jgi:hypothetical protein
MAENTTKSTADVRVFFRYTQERSDSKHAKWLLNNTPLDDKACAEAGYNLIGQALDVTDLSIEDRNFLLQESRGFFDDEDRLERILSSLDRVTVPGLDIDAGGPEGLVQVMLIGSRLLTAAGKLGIKLRASYSSGSDSAGLHLEFGPANDEAKDPDLLRSVGLLAVRLAQDAGLVPQEGSRVGSTGYPLFWTTPDLASAEGRNTPRLDLSVFNHRPGSKGRMFRPLGGLNKAGTKRKALMAGSPSEGSPITLSLLSLAVDPKEREEHSKTCRRKRLAVREDLPQLSNTVFGKRLAQSRDEIKRYLVSGHNHDLSLAIASTVISSGLVNDSKLARILTLWTGSLQQAKADVSSTRRRLARGRPATGAPTVRSILGPLRTIGLCLAVSSLCDQPLLSWVRAFFGASSKRELLAERQTLPHLEALESDEHSVKAVKFNGSCGAYRVDADCVACNMPRNSYRLRCDNRLGCYRCLVSRITRLYYSAKKTWPEKRLLIAKSRTTFATRGAAMDEWRKVRNYAGNHWLVFYFPITQDSWAFTAITRDDGTNLSISAVAPYCDVIDDADKEEGLRYVVASYMMTAITYQQLLWERQYQDAARLRLAVRNKRFYTQPTTAPCALPTCEKLDEERAQWINERPIEDGACPCQLSEPASYTYSHIATGRVVAEREHYPLPYHAVCKRDQDPPPRRGIVSNGRVIPVPPKRE